MLPLQYRDQVCMYLNSKRYKHLVKPSFYLNGAPICYVDKEKYLGFIINSLSKHDVLWGAFRVIAQVRVIPSESDQ